MFLVDFYVKIMQILCKDCRPSLNTVVKSVLNIKNFPLVCCQDFRSGFTGEGQEGLVSVTHDVSPGLCLELHALRPCSRTAGCRPGVCVFSANSLEILRHSPIKNHLPCPESQKKIISPTHLIQTLKPEPKSRRRKQV